MENIKKFQDYLSIEKRYSAHTVRAYINDVEEFCAFSAIDNFQGVTFNLVRAWMAELSNHNKNHKTINRKISALKAYFKFLYITKSIDAYPLTLIKNLKIQKNITIPFSENEIINVLNQHIDENDFEQVRNQLIILFFYNFGLRKSELISLTSTNVTFEYIRIMGKGNKERILPMPKKMVTYIRNYVRLKQHVFEEKISNVFFVNKKGEKLNQSFVYRLINDYFRAFTTKEKKSPHVLRHSFATLLIENDAEINAVKELMGHSTLKVTENYVHQNMQQLKAIYNNAHPRSKKT